MEKIIQAITKAGGKPYKVGGCVRDKILGVDSKDIDIEVFGLDKEKLISILSQFGKVDAVGVSFGVIKLTTKDQDYDFSLPRTDKKVSEGHNGFEITVDHTLSLFEAAKRRDFTINAISEDFEGNLYDPHNGISDLKAKRLIATSDQFGEDPIRVLRGMRFCAIMKLEADDRTLGMCKEIYSEAHTIDLNRINGEFVKFFLKSQQPSMGLKFLKQTGWTKLFPELHNLIGCEQEHEYHPEGDVYTHTALVCDEAVNIAIRDNLSKEDRLILVIAALCHDLGKATTTFIKNGRIVSPGHAKAGEALTISFLEKIGFVRTSNVTKQVVPLVVEHMSHIGVEVNERFVRRLSDRVAPSNLNQLVRLMEADHSGRSPLPKKCPENAKTILEVAKQLQVVDGKPKPIIMGRHLIDLGMKPGP